VNVSYGTSSPGLPRTKSIEACVCVCVVHTTQNPYKISHEKESGKQKPKLKCKKEKGQAIEIIAGNCGS